MHLSEAERIYIHRRRLQLTQAQMAAKLGLAHHHYSAYENGLESPPKKIVPKKSSPTDLEECVIARRRENLTQVDMAALLDCSRLWVNKMESGNANPGLLLDYWNSY